MTVPSKWTTMDPQQATQVLTTHVPRGDREGRRICVICRTWVERDAYTLVPQWPCDEVRRARIAVSNSQPLPENRPPAMPTSVARALRVPEWQRAKMVTTPTFAVPPAREESEKRKKMAIELDVEPDKNHHGVVFPVTDSSENLYETVEMTADDARLFALKIIRAADASERRGWTG